MALQSEIAVRRARACKTFLEQAHAATAAEGINPSTLHAIKLKLVAFAKRAELFPLADFAMPTICAALNRVGLNLGANALYSATGIVAVFMIHSPIHPIC